MKRFGLLPILLVLASCFPTAEPHPADLVILGATVIDGRGGEPRAATDIFVLDGLINAVAPTGALMPPPGATVVDARTAFVMPGLADMHVHFSLGLPGPRKIGETEEVLRRLLYS